MIEPERAAVDVARTVALGEAWAVAVCIDPRGQETYWLLSPDQDAEAGCACHQCAPHEQETAYVIGQGTTTGHRHQTGHAS